MVNLDSHWIGMEDQKISSYDVGKFVGSFLEKKMARGSGNSVQDTCPEYAELWAHPGWGEGRRRGASVRAGVGWSPGPFFL